ncbi:MAG: phosphatase PAP2 family protein [Pseudomonadota bacterium]|nr:phosphatase PAP2 family protein [Pseudomonadota bacterium]
MGLNGDLFEALNAIAGRSWAIDSLIALGLDSLVVKAGPIGACFFYAWYRAGDAASEAARRHILLVTLASLFLIAPLTKNLSDAWLAPRPFLMAEQTYVLQDGGLSEAPRVQMRSVQSGEMVGRAQRLREGHVSGNDLVSFPSDHAAFFIALSLGIWLASRAAGAIALAWTLIVTLGSRVAAGMHWPADIGAGAMIGAAMLLLVQLAFAGRRAGLWEPVLRWASRFPGVTAAFLFLLLIEAANTMQTLKRGLEIASSVAGRLL